MITTVTQTTSTTALLLCSLNPKPIPRYDSSHALLQRNKCNRSTRRNIKCRAGLTQEAPLTIAMGACMLNSVVFPVSYDVEDDQDIEGGAVDEMNARLAVMGIISFVPYFNWLSWVFAWLDTRKPRYLFYTIVYLVPYIGSNLSLSPEESWLPITSIIFCIIHIQLEASVKNGDLKRFQLFKGSQKHVSPSSKKNSAHFDGYKVIINKERITDERELPTADEQRRNELRGWGVSEKPHDEYLNDTEDAKDRKHD